ncbi:hypothetical protein [Fodinicola feengrottensis]|uniref:Uncharacterized protein n=1 Tax=Fodinicola feengrottensis TaxID=435914 RepID=A0ABN2IUR1_9ACTN|nr:hypothetical protein [Fodinicola feengrottensis]
MADYGARHAGRSALLGLVDRCASLAIGLAAGALLVPLLLALRLVG